MSFTPLRGARVLDLTRILAGPFATMLLADLGAEVLKVERPAEGDDTRATGPHFIEGISAYFASINRGKKSVALDFSKPEGRAVLFDLVSRSDVLVENFRSGVSDRLGLTRETVSERFPRLVMVGMSAFGRTGPDAALPAFDLTLQARGGTMGLTGEPGGAPVRMGPPMGDLAGGMYAALAVSSALYERERTGKGAFVDLSLLDCQVSLLTYAASFYLNAGAVLAPMGNAHAHATPYESFETADTPVVIAVFTDRFWPEFCACIDETAWARDPSLATHAQRRASSERWLPRAREVLRTRPARAWLERFYAAGVPSAPVNSVDAVFADPQVLARGMRAELASSDGPALRAAGNPLRATSDGSPQRYEGPPRLGAHTEEILRGIAGYDDARIGALRAAAVIP